MKKEFDKSIPDEIFVEKIENIFATFEVCPDKSITIRAILLAGFASGRTVIHNPLFCDDTLAAIDCVRQLGAKVERVLGDLIIDGAKDFADGRTYYCRQSGTVLRLLCGLLCGAGINAVLDGDEQLKSRPISRIIAPLTARGADISTQNGRLPIVIKPSKLTDFNYRMTVDSAQVKSAIILSGVTGGVKTEVTERNNTRAHTERMLPLFGVDTSVNDGQITVLPNKLKGTEVFVPNDPSACAYYLALGLFFGSVKVKGVNVSPERAGYLYKLIECGADITFDNERTVCGEKCADVIAKKSSPKHIDILPSEVPSMIDELPIIGLIGAYFNGITIKGAGELRVKESDRFNGLVDIINAVGGSVRADGDNLLIEGGFQPCKFSYRSDDHRLIMTAFVAMLSGEGGVLHGCQCVNKSFPDFFDNFNGFKACLIGEDVRKSLSGYTHNYFLENLKVINNYAYFLKSVSKVNAVEILNKSAYKSINVTIPYKELAFEVLKTHSFEAKAAQSVNFVFNNKGYSFDGDGLIYSLKRNCFDVKGKNVLICGIGGAGRSVCVSLLKQGAQVYIENRTAEKAEQYVAHCREIAKLINNKKIEYYGENDFLPPMIYDGKPCDLVINATSVKAGLPSDKDIFNGCTFAVDINYGVVTDFMREAEKNGIVCVDGLEMLYAQSYFADALISEKMPVFDEFCTLFDNFLKNNHY